MWGFLVSSFGIFYTTSKALGADVVRWLMHSSLPRIMGVFFGTSILDLLRGTSLGGDLNCTERGFNFLSRGLNPDLRGLLLLLRGLNPDLRGLLLFLRELIL